MEYIDPVHLCVSHGFHEAHGSGGYLMDHMDSMSLMSSMHLLELMDSTNLKDCMDLMGNRCKAFYDVARCELGISGDLLFAGPCQRLPRVSGETSICSTRPSVTIRTLESPKMLFRHLDLNRLLVKIDAISWRKRFQVKFRMVLESPQRRPGGRTKIGSKSTSERFGTLPSDLREGPAGRNQDKT